MATETLVPVTGDIVSKTNVAGTDAENITSLATDDSWTDRSTGDRQERTEWHSIVAWERLAEICGQYLSKGRQVYIEGRIETRSWEDRDKNQRTTTEIVANRVVLLGSRGGGGRLCTEYLRGLPRGQGCAPPPAFREARVIRG